MSGRPPIAVVPMFVRCRWCEGVFRASTQWPHDVRTSYRRCRWCDRLTRLPSRACGSTGAPGTTV
ncbi:MAG TPA: hypothetical protein VM307_01330, partial [Egibacteraceae bacterium]|nr:hypothetical protein [Egibacteraceae bacterium]